MTGCATSQHVSGIIPGDARYSHGHAATRTGIVPAVTNPIATGSPAEAGPASARPHIDPSTNEPRWGRPTKLLVAVIGVVFLACASPKPAQTSDTGGANAGTGSIGAPAPGAPEASTEPAPTEPKETVSQRNARQKAEQYLRVSAFSRTGLVKQLTFESFSQEDANYAVDAVGADWTEQADKKAQQYMATQSFSRAGLIKQLQFEGFTAEQAAHGAAAVGL